MDEQGAWDIAAHDPRWAELADLVVRWSTGVRPGDRVLISMAEPETFQVARLIHAAVVRAGGNTQVMFGSERLERDLLRLGTAVQADWLPELEQWAMEWADVSIALRAGGAVEDDDGLAADRVAARRGVLGRISATRTVGTRWVLVRLPTAGLARRAEMRQEDLVDAFFRAALRDWEREGNRSREAAALFAGGREVHVRGRDTDLRFSIAGRAWLIEDGHINMPGGEIATSPEEESAEGEIHFEGPAIFAGHVFSGIHLRLAAGRVVEAHADRNDALLHELLRLDDGARRIGEIGFGTNDGMRDVCGDLLYDEKVPGTFHLALGRSYAACGGTNASALHWDIVKDLREEGTVTVDGRLVFDGGRLLNR